MTESLRLRSENKYLSTPWSELIDRNPPPTRSGDEIAAQVIRDAGLHLA